MTSERDIVEFQDSIRKNDLERVRGLLARNPSLVDARGKDGLSNIMLALYSGAAGVVGELRSRKRGLDVFEAAALGDDASLRSILLSEPGAVDSFSPDGWTPLHLAAHFGQPTVMRELLAHGASVAVVARNGIANQPLQAALAGRRIDAVRILLSAGADLNHRSHGGFTAAHIAAENGDAEALQLLWKAGADLQATTDGGKTPLALVSTEKHAVRNWIRSHEGIRPNLKREPERQDS